MKANFEWPTTKHHASSNDFTTWRKTLEYFFPNEQLSVQLDSWVLDKQSEWLDYWDWLVTTDGQFLYFRHGPSVVSPNVLPLSEL